MAGSSTPANADGGWVFGRTILMGFSNCRILVRLLAYERRIEQSLCQAMHELERLKHLGALDATRENPRNCGLGI